MTRGEHRAFRWFSRHLRAESRLEMPPFWGPGYRAPSLFLQARTSSRASARSLEEPTQRGRGVARLPSPRKVPEGFGGPPLINPKEEKTEEARGSERGGSFAAFFAAA